MKQKRPASQSSHLRNWIGDLQTITSGGRGIQTTCPHPPRPRTGLSLRGPEQHGRSLARSRILVRHGHPSVERTPVALVVGQHWGCAGVSRATPTPSQLFAQGPWLLRLCVWRVTLAICTAMTSSILVFCHGHGQHCPHTVSSLSDAWPCAEARSHIGPTPPEPHIPSESAQQSTGLR